MIHARTISDGPANADFTGWPDETVGLMVTLGSRLSVESAGVHRPATVVPPGRGAASSFPGVFLIRVDEVGGLPRLTRGSPARRPSTTVGVSRDLPRGHALLPGHVLAPPPHLSPHIHVDRPFAARSERCYGCT